MREKQGDDDGGETADQVGGRVSGHTATRRQPLDTGSLQHQVNGEGDCETGNPRPAKKDGGVRHMKQ
jgi:hypothetical protein